MTSKNKRVTKRPKRIQVTKLDNDTKENSCEISRSTRDQQKQKTLTKRLKRIQGTKSDDNNTKGKRSQIEGGQRWEAKAVKTEARRNTRDRGDIITDGVVRVGRGLCM